MQRLHAAGALEDAAGAAMVVGAVAAHNHADRWADDRLEAALLDGAAALGPFPTWTGRESGRVLHVCSSAPPFGGHSRLAWRTVALDPQAQHDLVVTLAPDAIDGALAAAVDRTHHLSPPGAGPLARARELRALAAGHEAVVCYLDPHDVLPVLAFAGARPGERPPVLGWDVTDHTAQVHRTAFDLRLVNRPFAERIALERRGEPAERVALLPLPVTRPPRQDRATARRELGVPDGTTLIVTVGSAYKYETGGVHLLDLVEPVLAAHPGALLLAAGPEDTGRWALARRRTGRVHAVGHAPLDRVWAAADVFLEPYPCGASTAALEAVACGVPVLGFWPDQDEADLLAPGAAMQGAWPVARTPEEHAGLLAAFLTDPGRCAAAAARAREVTALSHDHAAWAAELRALRGRALALGPRRCRDAGSDPAELRDAPARHDGPDRVVAALHERGGKELAPQGVQRLQALLDAAGDPLGRPRFAPHLVDDLGWPAVTDPAPAICLEATPHDAAQQVRRLRAFFLAGLAAHVALTVRRDVRDATVPLVEAALAAGTDVPLDLHVVDATVAVA